MTAPSMVRDTADANGFYLYGAFDWVQHVLRYPKVLVMGNTASGKTQYLASLPYAHVDWSDKDNIIAVMPSSAETVARIADAMYRPGQTPGSAAPNSYRILFKSAHDREALTLGRSAVTLADIPGLVIDGNLNRNVMLNTQFWQENPRVLIDGLELTIQEHCATAIGLIFVIDPFSGGEDGSTDEPKNEFVFSILQQIEFVLGRWEEQGATNIPTRERPIPIAVVATKADGLSETHPLSKKPIELRQLVGDEPAESIGRLGFKPFCDTLSAWGEGTTARIAGTRYQPSGVLMPLQHIFRELPDLVGRARR